MPRVTVTKAELMDLADNQPIETERYKSWGTLETYHVVKDGKDYLVNVIAHHSEGWQDDTYELIPAKKIQVTTEKWVEDDEEPQYTTLTNYPYPDLIK